MKKYLKKITSVLTACTLIGSLCLATTVYAAEITEETDLTSEIVSSEAEEADLTSEIASSETEESAESSLLSDDSSSNASLPSLRENFNATANTLSDSDDESLLLAAIAEEQDYLAMYIDLAKEIFYPFEIFFGAATMQNLKDTIASIEALLAVDISAYDLTELQTYYDSLLAAYDQIDTAVEDLLTTEIVVTKDMLVTAQNELAVQLNIAKAVDTDAKYYTYDSLAFLESYIAFAEELVAQNINDLDVEDYEAFYTDIIDAYFGLQIAVEFLTEIDVFEVEYALALLQDTLDEALTYNKADYTQASFAALEAAIAAAQDILNNPVDYELLDYEDLVAYYYEIIDCMLDLYDAMDGLVELGTVSSNGSGVKTSSTSVSTVAVASTPNTGDTSPVLPVIILLGIAVCAVVLVKARKVK